MAQQDRANAILAGLGLGQRTPFDATGHAQLKGGCSAPRFLARIKDGDLVSTTDVCKVEDGFACTCYCCMIVDVAARTGAKTQ